MNFHFENSSIPPLPFGDQFIFEDEFENNSELPITKESLNSFNLSIFKNKIIDDSFPNIFPFLKQEEKNTINIIIEEKSEEFDEKIQLNKNKEIKENQKTLESHKNEDKDKELITNQKNLIQLVKRKRGRGKKGEINSSLRENDRIHNKFSTDNLLRKLQVHYISFIILFVNDILKHLNYEERFFKIDYNFKKNINKKFIESLKSKNIGEIVCTQISDKYKKKDKNSNQIIYDKIKEDKVINNILSENYLKLFKNIYYKNNNRISLKEYGLDKDIILSKKVKLFKDLIKDNEASKEYQENINECALQNFLENSFLN